MRVPSRGHRPRVQEHLSGSVPEPPHAGRSFAANLRALDRGEAGGFDSFDVPIGSGLPGSGATVLAAGEGERLEGETRVATMKIGRDELTLIEFELEPSLKAPTRTPTTITWTRSTSSRARSSSGSAARGAWPAPAPCRRAAGSRPHVHPVTRRRRLLNIHAPGAGFHDWLREIG